MFGCEVIEFKYVDSHTCFSDRNFSFSISGRMLMEGLLGLSVSFPVFNGFFLKSRRKSEFSFGVLRGVT
jgi:hypothetical protein